MGREPPGALFLTDQNMDKNRLYIFLTFKLIVFFSLIACTPKANLTDVGDTSKKIAKSNGIFYCDSSLERRIDGWRIVGQEKDHQVLSTSFEVEKAGRFTLVFQSGVSKTDDFKVDGKLFRFSWDESEIAYLSEQSTVSGLARAYKIDLKAGRHDLVLRLKAKPGVELSSLKVALCSEPDIRKNKHGSWMIKDPGQRVTISDEKIPEPDLKGFEPGIGTEPCAGRFGFTKGDGVLDCGMPLLGIIDKSYVGGRPDHKQPYKWTISLLPPGIDPSRAYHGTFEPAQTGIENDRISVNHLSVKWQTSFNATGDFFSRRAGEKVGFACTYSLGSPGILVESSDPGISLSKLETAGNYQYLMIPRKNGILCSVLDENYTFDGKMDENWMLIFGATEFPDIPILLVFEKAPTEIRVRKASNGRLQALDFHIPSQDAKLFVATPFGIESLSPRTPDNRSFINDVVERCRFWSRAFLAFPVKCEEFFRIDREEEKVDIIQKFDYRFINDQWNTPPLQTAPYPPALAMLDSTGIVRFDKDAQDFRFPTKYGYLKGTMGRYYSSYTIPFMPCERKFPLRNIRRDTISSLLSDGLDDYFKFHDQFTSSQQAYPYSGSSMEPYAWSAPLFNFMDKRNREKLSGKCRERLGIACDPEWQYRYPIIHWGNLMKEMPGRERVLEIYRDTAMKYMDLYNWYRRREPFTGVEYNLCYLNVGLFSGGTIKTGTREEIAGLKVPLIENDWGNGLTLYYMYLSGLACGSFKPVKQNWNTLREMFRYYEIMHDWACMGTGYSDNGIIWVEGANYGAFTSMVNMSEAIGEEAANHKAIYLSAKQLILRLAIFRSAQRYFYRFVNHPPWYIEKFWGEESNISNGFMHVPACTSSGRNFYTIYNLTTEGLYPELFQALLKFLPDEWKEVRKIAMEALAGTNMSDPGVYTWGVIQQVCCCLIAAALDETFDEDQLLNEIRDAENKGQLIREWRGIHIYSRLLPENYFKCQILAWLENRNHPVWLTHWVNTEIVRADYDNDKKKAIIEFRLTGDKGMIRFGVREKPTGVYLEGKNVGYTLDGKGRLGISLSSPGILEIQF